MCIIMSTVSLSFSRSASLCCTCGVPIPPNPANMCVSCLRTQVDISEGIPKQVSIHFCRQCERYFCISNDDTSQVLFNGYVYVMIAFCFCRYLQPPGTWVQCTLESRELLALCLKKLKSSMAKVDDIQQSPDNSHEPISKLTLCFVCYRQVRLIDAGFLWTEPHSKRIKMKLTIQKEVC